MVTKSSKTRTLGSVALSVALASGIAQHLRAQEIDAAVTNGKVTLTATDDKPTAATSSTNPPAISQSSTTNRPEFYSKAGGYVMPLTVSVETTARQTGDDSESQAIDDLVKKNSQEGKWTLIITPLNRFKYPNSGLETYALLRGESTAYINIAWMPRPDAELGDDLKSKGDPIAAAQGLTCLDNPPAKLKVGGNDAVLIRYRSSKERDVLMGLDKDDRRYIVTMTAQGQEEPDSMAFSRVIKEFKLK